MTTGDRWPRYGLRPPATLWKGKAVTLLLAAALSAGCFADPEPQEQPREAGSDRPNILLILADDMGYTDIGSFGSEISTPNLDELAYQGTRFTNFHGMPTCAPSRAALLSGTNNHVAGMGSQFPGSVLSGIEDDDFGYEGHLHNRVASLPEVLASAGYHRYMVGKWHLGSEEGQWPTDRGFEKAFSLLGGASNHFSMGPGEYTENGEPLDKLPEDFYSTRTYTDKLIEYIDADIEDGRPFFAYAAYTAPHWPLQAPDTFLDRYAGQYDEGYDLLRKQRLDRAKGEGVIPDQPDYPFEPMGPSWQELTEAQQRQFARRMEIYAAMVENMDHHVGRLISYLEDQGQLDNTIILFLSDNGASGANKETSPRVQEQYANIDNSEDNLGREGSWVAYGRGWAQAAMAPYNRTKGWIKEGGRRVPAFIQYGGQEAETDFYPHFLSVQDVMPTLLDVAQAEHPGTRFQGRPVFPMTGRSFARVLKGDTESVYPDDHIFHFELHGSRSARQGDFKLVWEQPIRSWLMGFEKPDQWYRWRLYDLASDPGETSDVSDQYPQIREKLIQSWENWAETYGVATRVRIKNYQEVVEKAPDSLFLQTSDKAE